MTPADRDELRKMIASALQPMRDEIDSLRGTDTRHEDRFRSHSGAYREIAKSVGDVRETTNADLLRATTHLAGQIGELREDMNTKLASIKGAELAAVAGAHAAIATEKATLTTSLEVVANKKETRESRTEGRWRTVGTVIAIILAAVLNHLKG